MWVYARIRDAAPTQVHLDPIRRRDSDSSLPARVHADEPNAGEDRISIGNLSNMVVVAFGDRCCTRWPPLVGPPRPSTTARRQMMLACESNAEGRAQKKARPKGAEKMGNFRPALFDLEQTGV